MSTQLVVVESPAKARTLSRLLGRAFDVRASMGHVRDLPDRQFGVDIEHGFQARYVVIPRRARTVKELRQAAAKAEAIYLAPDPDREGEAIAWHLRETLASAAKKARFLRIAYHEITESAIRVAIAAPRDIDMNMVNAQQARRILDRIVGYRVSPFLQRRVNGATSAGRVQTAALRLVCLREKEIQGFQPREFWVIGVRAAKQIEPRTPFSARLIRIGDEKPEIATAEAAEAVRRELDDRPLRVAAVDRKTLARRAPPPFITSTLQQAASRMYGFVPSRTMRVAQTLYEGVDLGDGPVGLITYMRTDSVAIAAEAQAACREWIEQNHGAAYLPERPNVYRSKASAQEAHEAIRPTDVRRTPDSVAAFLKPDELKLYELVWRRFVASQMAPARFLQTQVDIEAVAPAGGRPYLFRATSSVVEFPGYLAAAGDVAVAAPAPAAEEEAGEEESQALPPLEPDEPLDRVGDWLAEQKFTQPPRRYSDATLVRAMEENGIGRPSTYAATVQLLYDRHYIEREKRAIRPTALGMAVHEYLSERLGELFDIGFTARMEEELDEVEEGRVDWRQMLSDFHAAFRRWMETARGADPHPDATQRLLDLLGRVRQWAPPRSGGRGSFNDEEFVASLRQRVEGGRPLSERQAAVLKRLAWSYRDQVPELADVLSELGWSEPPPETPAPSPADDERVTELLKALESVKFHPPRKVRGRTFDDARFFASLKEQIARGRRLTERQLDALESLARRYTDIAPRADRPAPVPPDNEDAATQTGAIRAMLEALAKVREWRPATERRGRRWDDREFYESIARQFREKGTLSPKQFAALRKMAARYDRPLLDPSDDAPATKRSPAP